MKIFITGGAGFIGSHTAVELLEAGYEVVIADNLCNSKPQTLSSIQEITGKAVKFYEADLRDLESTRRIFYENDISAVIHFAGLKSVSESVKFPLKYYENNLNATFVLLNAMEEAHCSNLVFSSSATVYGMNNSVPFNEDMPVSAINPYGCTKIMTERILTDMCAADHNLSVCLLRYFNPIGAHPSGLIGEDPNGVPNNLLPYVMQTAAGLRSEITVYGNDYDTPDGTGVRDYIHVADLALGHLAALKFVLTHKGIETVNLGTGKGVSVLEIIKAYSEACGKDLPYKIAGRREGDIAVCYADTSKAKRLFGWQAQKNIEQMCEDSYHFAKKRYR